MVGLGSIVNTEISLYEVKMEPTKGLSFSPALVHGIINPWDVVAEWQ